MTQTLFQVQRNGIQKLSAYREYLNNKHLSKNFLPADKETGKLQECFRRDYILNPRLFCSPPL